MMPFSPGVAAHTSKPKCLATASAFHFGRFSVQAPQHIVQVLVAILFEIQTHLFHGSRFGLATI
jgi:hypothetical protein